VRRGAECRPSGQRIYGTDAVGPFDDALQSGADIPAAFLEQAERGRVAVDVHSVGEAVILGNHYGAFPGYKALLDLLALFVRANLAVALMASRAHLFFGFVFMLSPQVGINRPALRCNAIQPKLCRAPASCRPH